MDNEGCAQGIAKAIENQPLLDKLTEYLESHDYGNESEVNKIYALM